MNMSIGISCSIYYNVVGFLFDGGIGLGFVSQQFAFPFLLMAAPVAFLRALEDYGKVILYRPCYLLL
jgi:hypothetical protein